MRKKREYNPLHVAAACATLVLALVMLLDPLFPPSPASNAGAIGDSVGLDVLGQTNGDEGYFDSNLAQDETNAIQMLPEDVALDPVGHRLFVSNGQTKGRILVFDLDSGNNLIDHVADAVLGAPDFKSVVPGLDADVFATGPLGMAYDSDNERLFVADSSNNRVLVFDAASITSGEDAANVLGQGGFTSNATGTDEFTMDTPTGLAYDADGERLFVSDRGNNRVLVFELLGGITDGMAAGNVLGQPNFTSNGNATTQDGLYLAGTFGVVPELAYVQSTDTLFVSDYNNARVMVFDVATIGDGELAVNVLGASDFTTGIGGLTSASNIALHSTGLTYDSADEVLYVSDSVDRILLFDLSDGVTDGEPAFDVIGQPNFAGQNPYCPDNNNNDICSYSIDDPQGLEFDPDNARLYAATSSSERVSIFEGANDGNPPPVAPPFAVDNLGQMDGAEEPVFDNTSSINAYGINLPESVALDEVNHRLFVADTGNNRVLMFSLTVDNEIDERAAAVSLGQLQVFDYTPSEGSPQCVVEYFREGSANNGAAGVFFPTECGDNSTNEAGLATPTGLAYDGTNDRLFVADSANNRVLVFQGPFTSGMDATNVLGQATFTASSPGLSATELNTPKDVAYDDINQRLFVADSGNDRVIIYDISGGITDGMAATGVLGAADLDTGGDNGLPPAPDTMGGPEGVTYDPTNNRLFVADFLRDRVVVYDLVDLVPPGSGITPQSHVLGQDDFTGYGPRGGQDGLNFTDCFYCSSNLHMAYDTNQNRLLVPDRFNHRIMMFDVAPGTIADGEDAIDVVAQGNFDDVDPGLSQNTVNTPQGIAVDSASGNVFIADTQNNRMMIFGPPEPPAPGGSTGGHNATNVVGQLDDADQPIFTTGGADNGPNRRGSSEPIGIAVDHVNHRLFASDYDNGRIMVYDLNTSNVMVDRVADAVLGHDDFKTGFCNGGASGICNPNGLALDEDARLLFVASYGGNRVLVFDVNEVESGEDAVHVLGQPDFDSSAPVTSQTGMNNPNGVEWYEEDQELFVADGTNNRVLVFDLSSGITDGMPASHVLGQPDFETGTPGEGSTGMEFASDVEYVGAAPSGLEHLYVSDRQNCRVLAFDISTITDGESADLVLGQPDLDTTDCGTDSHSFLATAGLSHNEAASLLFVDDFQNNRVMVFDVTDIDTDEDAVTVLGQPDFDSNTSAVGAEGLSDPEGVYYDDANDLLYITDTGNHRVLTYDGTALENGVAAIDGFNQLNPNDTVNFTANKPNNGPNIQGFDEADYAALDTVHHRLFATDLGNNRVLVFDLDDSNHIVDYDADFVLGQPDFKSNAAAAGPNGLVDASGLSYDSIDDRLFVADAGNARILVFDTATIANGEDAVNVLGQADFDGNGCGTSATTMCAPLDVSVEPLNGLLAVGDRDNNRVLVFDISGGITDGMPASKVFCQSDFDSNGSGTANDACTGPQGVLAETNTDSLWVTDSDNNRVLRFDLFAASSDPALNVLGQDDFTSNGAATTQNGMDNPVRLALVESDGSDQRLFVSDIDNNRVLVFNTANGVDDGEDAVDAYGQPDFTSNGCGTTISNLCAPVGLDYDETLRTLYVADKANNRVLIFGPTGGGGGGPQPTPEPVSITPDKILVNQDSSVTDSRNVLVTVWATNTPNFTGTVDVLLSNDPMFSTFIPFRYNVPGPGGEQNIWPKTIAWDLCFGLSVETCDPGHKTVYARFYVNVPLPTPVLTPRP